MGVKAELGDHGLSHLIAHSLVPISSSSTHMVYTSPFHPSNLDTMTITALEAVASSSNKNINI